MAGMEPTGKMDTKTMKKMMSKRCGMPDVIPDTAPPDDVMMDPIHREKNKAQNFYVPGIYRNISIFFWGGGYQHILGKKGGVN